LTGTIVAPRCASANSVMAVVGSLCDITPTRSPAPTPRAAYIAAARATCRATSRYESERPSNTMNSRSGTAAVRLASSEPRVARCAG